MTITIAVETPLQDDVRKLVADLNAHLIPLTPREFQFQLTVEQMAEPSITLFVARDDTGAPVGMGALKDHGDGVGEVKRMYTLPEVRGQHVGRRIVERIEALVREKAMTRLVLETGEAEAYASTYRFYEGNGFATCGVILDYPDSGFSRFYEKKMAR